MTPRVLLEFDGVADAVEDGDGARGRLFLFSTMPLSACGCVFSSLLTRRRWFGRFPECDQDVKALNGVFNGPVLDTSNHRQCVTTPDEALTLSLPQL